jgi:glycosyltransferase involved in cell wall biosynthesis
LTHEQRRRLELRVYGDGSLASSLRERAEREALPARFFGPEPDAQRHITDSCFAFLDGRMAIQEAMARRRLVFAAYVDPLKRDYVGMESFSPFVVPVGDGAELAQRVAYYIEHRNERETLTERAFQHARTLTWSRTAAAYLRLWTQRLAGSPPACSFWKRLRLVREIRREHRLPKTEWASAWAGLPESVPPSC